MTIVCNAVFRLTISYISRKVVINRDEREYVNAQLNLCQCESVSDSFDENSATNKHVLTE